MDQSTLKKLITLAIIIIVFIILFNFISWLAYKLLPVAILICAGYIVYKLVNK